MKPVAFTSGQFEGRFTYIPNNPSAVLPNGMALYSEPSAMLLEVANHLAECQELLREYPWVYQECKRILGKLK